MKSFFPHFNFHFRCAMWMKVRHSKVREQNYNEDNLIEVRSGEGKRESKRKKKRKKKSIRHPHFHCKFHF